MGKKFLRGSKVFIQAHETVDDAERMAMLMARHEARGPGDFLEAMRRVAERIGVPYGTFWNLRYRKPKSIATHEYLGIYAAFQNNKQKFEAERNEVAEPSKIGALLLRIADRAHSAAGRLAGEENGEAR